MGSQPNPPHKQHPHHHPLHDKPRKRAPSLLQRLHPKITNPKYRTRQQNNN